MPKGPEQAHRLSGLAVITFVTRGTILTLWGQKASAFCPLDGRHPEFTNQRPV